MLRRSVPLKASRGTRIPPALRIEVLRADQGCVGPTIGMPRDCAGPIELDHIRASHAIGKKSETVRSNLASLCRYEHHRQKTESGKKWRPRLLEYVEQRDAGVVG